MSGLQKTIRTVGTVLVIILGIIFFFVFLKGCAESAAHRPHAATKNAGLSSVAAPTAVMQTYTAPEGKYGPEIRVPPGYRFDFDTEESAKLLLRKNGGADQPVVGHIDLSTDLKTVEFKSTGPGSATVNYVVRPE
ncbi:MAG: hypothetical protein PHF79_00505 [Candidatus Pacebacteria bacterium]|nr:hypothetical protein [Candidatus Paceibacterota bacterium]